MKTKGTPKTGGRKPGTPNKVTKDIRELAQVFAEKTVAALFKIVEDETAPAQARVAAANSILDRAYGKPKESVAIETDLNSGVKSEAELRAMYEEGMRKSAQMDEEVRKRRQRMGWLTDSAS
jgi:hypothetical protein